MAHWIVDVRRLALAACQSLLVHALGGLATILFLAVLGIMGAGLAVLVRHLWGLFA